MTEYHYAHGVLEEQDTTVSVQGILNLLRSVFHHNATNRDTSFSEQDAYSCRFRVDDRTNWYWWNDILL